MKLDSEGLEHSLLLHQQELERLNKAYEAGVMLAVPAALDYCMEYGLRTPRWLVQAATTLLCDLLKRERSSKRGRSCGAVARYRQDMIDFMRFNEVEVVQENQNISADFLARYPTCPSPGAQPIYAEQVAKAKWLGTSKSRIYQCVSELLERTEAFGSPESIKRSYRQVKRHWTHPSRAFRYYQLQHSILKKLEIASDLGYGRYVKFFPWRKTSRGTRNRSGAA